MKNTYYLIEKGQILVNINDVVYAVTPDYTVWGTFIYAEKSRALISKTNKKEAQELAKSTGWVVVSKIYTEQEADEIREGQL